MFTRTPARLAAPTASMPSGGDGLSRAYQFSDLSGYSFKNRLMVRGVDLAFSTLIRLLGRTVRFEVVGRDNWESASAEGRVPIYTFWHDGIVLSTYFFRHRGIVVMTSQSLDGEYIARIIQRFGYGAARGSSTRGAVGAVIEMVRVMRHGRPTAFTIDGPKGPRRVAKMGAVLLAKKTGQPILPFAITPAHFWTVKSWDRLRVPKPLARTRVELGRPLFVPADAGNAALEGHRCELQASLDDLDRNGQEWRQNLGAA